MKKIINLIFVLILSVIGYYGIQMVWFSNSQPSGTYSKITIESKKNIQSGDIIFHTSRSTQSKAIQLATHSKYSHMGIIYQNGEEFFVYEAVQPVKLTKLSDWIARGENGHYVIKRLKNAVKILTPEILSKMQEVGNRFQGKDYDLYFEWSDDKMYCSEMVWKIYNEATGIKIGNLEKLSDFDLSNKEVKKKMLERYGSDFPLNQPVISPAAMFESNVLETVDEK